MKILLVKPLLSRKSSPFFEPPLGLMYLASFLKTKGYSDIRIIHMDIERMRLEDLGRLIQDDQPDVVGLSAITAEAENMFQIATLVKRISPETLVVAGGPHPTSYPEESLRSGDIDIAVLGEGEQTFWEILEHAQKKQPFDDISGVCFRDQDRILTTEKRKYIEDLDLLPMPDWGSVDIKKYKEFCCQSRMIYGELYMPLFTSRGCPFRCIYCHGIFGKKFRAHSVARVLEEIKILHEQFGIVHFEFLDDIFNFDRKRSVQIMQGIVDRGWKIKLYFPNGVRGDMMDEGLIDLFAEAGTVFMSFAVETASPRLQKEIQKHNDLEKISQMICYAAQKKIFVNGFFMLGFPGETREEMLKTIRFATSSPLHLGSFFLVHPFKGTVLGDWLEKSGKKIAKSSHSINYSLITPDSPNCSLYSHQQIRRLFNFAYVVFYLNPFRAFRILRDIPNKKVFTYLLTLFFSRLFLRKEIKLGPKKNLSAVV